MGTRGGAGVRAQLVVSPAGTGSDWGRRAMGGRSQHDCHGSMTATGLNVGTFGQWFPAKDRWLAGNFDFEIIGISLFDVFSLMFDTLTHYKLLQRIYPD